MLLIHCSNKMIEGHKLFITQEQDVSYLLTREHFSLMHLSEINASALTLRLQMHITNTGFK